MAPKLLKIEMLIFGLCSTYDDWPSNLSNESCPKCKIMVAKLSKNEMLVVGLHSTSDDQPSNLSDKVTPNANKWPPYHQKRKCSFLDYVQLLMIGQVIQVTKVTPNVKNWLPNEMKKLDLRTR